MEDGLLTTAEAARRLGVERQVVTNYIRRGRQSEHGRRGGAKVLLAARTVPYRRDQTQFLIDPADLVEFARQTGMPLRDETPSGASTADPLSMEALEKIFDLQQRHEAELNVVQLRAENQQLRTALAVALENEARLRHSVELLTQAVAALGNRPKTDTPTRP